MTSYVETKIVALTSQSATIKYNDNALSNLFYALGNVFSNDDNIIHTQVQLLNAQIPYSFYVINQTNNQFRYRLGIGTTYTSTIPVGNYNGNSLITALKQALTANSITLEITLSSINGKLTFTHASFNFTFFGSVANSILPILGFDDSTNYTSSGFTLGSPYPLNLLGIKTLQVRTNNLIMSNISSVQGGQTTLLSTIPVDCTPFGMINYVDKGSHLMTIHNDSLDDLQIEIIDGESSNFIDFNNADWCMTLAFHIMRTLEPIQKPTMRSIVVGKPTVSPILEEKPQEKKQEEPPLEKIPESKDIQELNLLTQ